jgi:hypothetical protein
MDGDILPGGFALVLILIIVVFRAITPFGCLGAFFCVIAILDKRARCDPMALFLSCISFVVNLASCASCLLIWLDHGNSSSWWCIGSA